MERATQPIARRARRLFWLAGIFLLSASVAPASAAQTPRFVPGRLLVRPRDGLSETNFTAKLRDHGAAHRATLRRLNVRVVTVPEEQAEATLAALQSDPEIAFAERDFIAEAAYVPNDALVVSGSEWHVNAIHADAAWNLTAGTGNTIVAVLDSGIDFTHPDLAGQVLPGYDFVWNDADPADDFGHGTAVAGTIAAAGNNGIGVAGVAFGCRVLPVKVMDASGFAYYSTMAQGIRFAADNGARVINISIAGSSPSSTLQEAIDYAWSKNVLVVAAAGNNADNTPQYPAACEHVVAVSATEPDDSLAWFSSYGNHLALAAPGDAIWTTQRDPANPYGTWRGTSFASPIVAGVAALVASANPTLSNTQIVSALEQSADDLGAAGRDALFGFGRVNAANAVSLALAWPGGMPSPPPIATNAVPETNSVAPISFAKARFTGLLIDTNGVRPDSSGFFGLNTVPSGAFSGKLVLAGKGRGFHGQFNPTNGIATIVLNRGKLLNPLTITLRLDAAQANSVAGTVTDGEWISELAGDRNVFNAKLNPPPQVGARAFVLEQPAEPEAEAANGSGTIAKSGATRVKGRLNDGRAFSAGSVLAPNGDCPFYLSLSRGSEVIVGWLNFPATPTPTASGSVVWVRTGTNAFAATLRATSAP